nr:hypothetical protein [Tanacetum cinerariifolium]
CRKSGHVKSFPQCHGNKLKLRIQDEEGDSDEDHGDADEGVSDEDVNDVDEGVSDEEHDDAGEGDSDKEDEEYEVKESKDGEESNKDVLGFRKYSYFLCASYRQTVFKGGLKKSFQSYETILFEQNQVHVDDFEVGDRGDNNDDDGNNNDGRENVDGGEKIVGGQNDDPGNEKQSAEAENPVDAFQNQE